MEPCADVKDETKFGNLTLYVGDLDSGVEEHDLYNLFSKISKVSSIKICRDRNTGSSLGYAYVNFNDISHAEKAMKELNFKEIKGKRMRIMFSKRDPSMRKSGEGNLFVKNLADSIGSKELFHLFSSYGRILSCKVACDATGVPKGYGFVHFESVTSAEQAIVGLNETFVREQFLQVCHFVSRHQLEKSPVFTNVYVKNLDESATDTDLKMIFGEFGLITSAVVMKDNKGKSRKFGFVSFENAEAAAAAVEKMNGTIISEKELYVGRAQKKKTRAEDLRAQIKLEQSRRNMSVSKGLILYVKNIDDSVNEEELRKLFSEFGTISSYKIMVDSNGLSKGVGFVEFSTSEEASKAMKEMNGKMVEQKQIYVSLAQCKEKHKSQNVVTSIPRPSLHQHPIFSQAAAPGLVLPPQHRFSGYNCQLFQPQSMFGPRPRLPSGVPVWSVPTFPFQMPTQFGGLPFYPYKG